METKEYSDYKILHSDPRRPDPRYVRHYHLEGKDYARDGIGQGTAHEKGYLPIISMAGTDNEDGTGTVTLTVTDWMGGAVTDAYMLRLWLSGSALGAPTDPGNIAATTGRILVEEVTDALCTVATDASGVAVLTITATSNGTQIVHAAVIGKITAGSLAVSGNS